MGFVRKLDSHFSHERSGTEWGAVKEFLPMAIAEFDDLGAYIGCNLSMQGLTGLGEQEMEDFFSDRIPELKLEPSLCDILSSAMGRKSRKTFQVNLINGDSVSRLLMGVVFPRLSKSQTVTGHLLALVDVTAERDLRQEVRFQNSLLSNLLSHTEDIVLEFSRAPGASLMRGHVPLEWNWSGPELESAFESLHARIHKSDVGQFDQSLISLTNDKTPAVKISCRLEMQEGEYGQYDVTFSKLHPKPMRSFLIVFKKRESSREDDTLHGVAIAPVKQPRSEEVCGFIAHEIKNMLQLIQLESARGIEVMQGANPRSERAIKALKSIGRANERITALIKAIEDFSTHRDIIDKEWLNLKQLLEDFIQFTGKSLRMSDGKVLLECSESIKFNTNSILLQIVLMNLFKNAMDSMRESDEKLISIRGQELDGNIVIRFQDSGPGIHSEIAERLFEAGASTKGHGRGTGLYLCSLIIRKMGGELKLLSHKPACFEIIIPNS